MKPVVDGIMKRYEGKVELRRMDANAADTQQLANSYGVQYVPTFVFVDKGGQRVDEVVGEMSEQQLTQKLDALVAAK